MRRTALSLCAAGLLLAAACTTTTGNNFADEDIAAIEVGQTTTQEARAALGDPFRTNATADGTEVWTYFFMKQTHSPTARSFVPLIGLSGNTTHADINRRELKLTFAASVLESCLMITTQSRGDLVEASLGGDKQEVACG